MRWTIILDPMDIKTQGKKKLGHQSFSIQKRGGWEDTKREEFGT
jgi:hypothetical protein